MIEFDWGRRFRRYSRRLLVAQRFVLRSHRDRARVPTPPGTAMLMSIAGVACKLGADWCLLSSALSGATSMVTSYGPYQVYAGYRQFYLFDHDQPGDTASPAFWTNEATDMRLATQPGVIAVGTDTHGEVPVTIEVLGAEPTMSLSAWDHVVEGSLHLSMGCLAIAGCPDMDMPIARISLAPGWFRLRVHSAGLRDEPPEVEYSGDSYLAQVWASMPRERFVLKKFRN